MSQDYPNTQGFAYTFARAELTMGSKVYTAITNVSIDQPTESEAVKGTSPYPLAETEGTMDLGEGTVTFSNDAERFQFLADLGNGFRNKRWSLSWILRDTESGNENQVKCVGCRVTGNPIDHSEGTAALGGDVSFKFLYHTINGNKPHG